MLLAFEGRALTVDVAVARKATGLHVPDLRPHRDALIAATALVHGMTVVTWNVADFAPILETGEQEELLRRNSFRKRTCCQRTAARPSAMQGASHNAGRASKRLGPPRV